MAANDEMNCEHLVLKMSANKSADVFNLYASLVRLKQIWCVLTLHLIKHGIFGNV